MLEKKVLYMFRRGLKETDMLFEKFKEKYFDNLTNEDLVELSQILEQTDQDILAKYIEKKCSNPTELEQKLMQL